MGHCHAFWGAKHRILAKRAPYKLIRIGLIGVYLRKFTQNEGSSRRQKKPCARQG